MWGTHPSLHNRKRLWVCLRYLTVLDIFLEEYPGNGSFWQAGWGLEWEEECHFIVYPVHFLRCACVILIIIMIQNLNITVSQFSVFLHCSKLPLLLLFCKLVT